jgi:hypothetical protein
VLSVAAAVAVIVGATVWLRADEPKKEKTKAEIKDLMKKTNKGDDSPMGKLSKELKADEPNWEELQKQIKEVSALATALGDYKGNAKVIESYQKNAEALEAAAGKKDKTAAVEARQNLLKSCGGCHYGGAPSGTGGGSK